MREYLITVGLLAAALLFYAASMSVPAVALAAIAVFLESLFWFRVLRKRRAVSDSR